MLVLALCGCADTGYSYVWKKRGATDADLQRDGYECERDVRAAAGSFSGGVFGAGEAQAFGQRCMQAKGWALMPTTATFAPDPPGQAPVDRDAMGQRIYPPEALVLCVLPNVAGSSTIQAKQCLAAGGTIAGPAPI